MGTSKIKTLRAYLVVEVGLITLLLATVRADKPGVIVADVPVAMLRRAFEVAVNSPQTKLLAEAKHLVASLTVQNAKPHKKLCS